MDQAKENTVDIETFYVMGLTIRTTNEGEQSARDIPELWNRFMSGKMAERIPGKQGEAVYCIYADYEKDHTRPYSVFLGCRVTADQPVPDEFVIKKIAGGKYWRRLAKGNILQGSVYNAWIDIWNSNIPRAFESDFEVYGEKAIDPQKAEVEIFLSVR